MSEITIEPRLARNYTMANVPDALAYLLVKLVPDSSANFGSLPLNIGLVIDISRSMKGAKIREAVEAAKLLIDSMSPNDWLSVTIFSDEAKAIIPCTNITDRTSLKAAVNAIRIQSGTRMFLGMDLGFKEMSKPGLTDKVNRMILLTDGETEGEELVRTIAKQERDEKIVISALGIGDRYNEELLAEISNITLGYFLHLKTPEQIKQILNKELSITSSSIISNVKLDIKLAEGVRIESFERIFPGYSNLHLDNQAAGSIISVNVGNISKDEISVFGIRLRLPSCQTGKINIVELAVLYSIPFLRIEDRIVNSNIIVECTDNEDLCGKADEEVLGYFNQLNAQNLVEKAISESKAGDINAAAKSLSQARDITTRLGNTPLTENITEAIDELVKNKAISADGLKTIKAGSRRTVIIEKTGRN